jgi:hypothetical protein
VVRLRHLVMVVPGVGGSRLETSGGVRWDVGVRGVLSAVADLSRLSLSEYPDLVPTGVTSVGVVPWLGVVPSLDRLTRNIADAFDGVRVDPGGRPGRRDPAADVVVFSYDFRRSVADAARRLAAEVAARLEGLPASQRRGRVVVVAYSMGGLVARYWLGPLGGWEVCRALVTLGTPHRGAPKALDWLANGPHVGRFAIPGAAEVLAEWPSVFELLPSYPVVLDVATGRHLYPRQLPLPAFARPAASAFRLHGDIERAWAEIPPERMPEVVPVFSRGHATLGRAVWDGARVSVEKRDAEWLPNVGWAGDATVPAMSAIPIELAERRDRWQAVGARHLRLPTSEIVVEKLREFAGEPPEPVPGGDTPPRPWLGLDLDELIPAGQPVPLRATLYGAEPGAGTAVWASTRPVGEAAGRRRHRMTAGPAGWTALLPAMDPGLYEVAVEAVNVPQWDSVRCDDLLAVVAT